MLKLVKKFKRKETQKELVNIIEFSKVLLDVPTEKDGTKPIFNLIKLMIDNILYEDLSNVANGIEYSDIREFDYILKCLPDEINKQNKTNNNVKENFVYNEKTKIKIKLGEDPVITFPYRKDKLKESLLLVGTDENKWKQQKYLHYFALYLPIGLAVIKTNGNYSVATGIVKSVGELIVGDSETNSIYNISRAYNLVRFDGERFVNVLQKSTVTYMKLEELLKKKTFLLFMVKNFKFILR